MAQRRHKVIRRTTVPADMKHSLGNIINFHLREEHIRWRRQEKKNNNKPFTVERVCDSTRIPYATMVSYLQGKRTPSLIDLRDICKFAGVAMEKVLEVIPSRVELDAVWKRAQDDRIQEDDDDETDSG